MHKALALLGRQLKLFRFNYSTEYKTFVTAFVLADPAHPLHETQKRRHRERKKEGLWWHVTTGNETSKSSCVRSWLRRRLRTAMVQELHARGYNENGMAIVPKEAAHSRDTNPQKPPNQLSLLGGLRLHALSPLIPAKFVDVKAEVGKVIDVIRMGSGNRGSDNSSPQKGARYVARQKPFPKSLAKKSTILNSVKVSG
ncbi:hypothetical protein ACEQ8H_003089 [Pleosporales sp. CAS-2024a]